MFALLNKKSFVNTKNHLQFAKEAHEQELPDNPNFITDPEHIVFILNKIKSTGLPCHLNVNNKAPQYLTSLLKVQPNEDYMILDEISSASGKHIPTTGNNIKLSVLYNGINLSFTLNSLELVSPHHNAYYKTVLPKRIYYPQRRTSRRISCLSGDIRFQGVSMESLNPLVGKVNNISLTGIGVNLHNTTLPIGRGNKLSDCHILLPDGFDFKFDLSIRFAKPQSHNNKTTRIGGHFEKISPDIQKKLERCIATLERKEIRKMRVYS
jgi:c-di-GMP-binding flagellar brake protein YcgR